MIKKSCKKLNASKYVNKIIANKIKIFKRVLFYGLAVAIGVFLGFAF